MIGSHPKQYEALFAQFKRLHPEYADEVPYFPRDDVLRAFAKWAGAVGAQRLTSCVENAKANPLKGSPE